MGEFEQMILYAVVRLGDGAYGLAIRRLIEDRTGRSVNSGAVYTALDRLEKRGMVSSSMGEPTPERGGRRKRFYRIEREGAEALLRTHEALDAMSRGLGKTISALADSNG